MDSKTYALLESYIQKRIKNIYKNQKPNDYIKNQNGKGKSYSSSLSESTRFQRSNSSYSESPSSVKSLSLESPIRPIRPIKSIKSIKSIRSKSPKSPNSQRNQHMLKNQKNDNSESLSLSFDDKIRVRTSPPIGPIGPIGPIVPINQRVTKTEMSKKQMDHKKPGYFTKKKMTTLILLFVIFLVGYFTYNYTLFLQNPQVTVKTIPAFWKMHSQTIISKMQTLFSWSGEQSQYIFDALKRQQIFQNLSNFLLKYKDIKPASLIHYLKNNAIKNQMATMINWMKGTKTIAMQYMTSPNVILEIFFRTIITPITQIIWQSISKFSSLDVEIALKGNVQQNRQKLALS